MGEQSLRTKDLLNDEHSIFVEICLVSANHLPAGCSSRRARVRRIAAACWCPSRGLRKPDSGTNLSTRTVEVRPWARLPSGLPTLITWGAKHPGLPVGEECVNVGYRGRAVPQQRHPAREGRTVGYLCRAHGSFHSKGHCVEKGWARNDWFLLGSISRSGSSGPTDRFLLFCFALSLFVLVTHEDTESKIRTEKRLHCAASILFPQYVCIT